MESHLLPVGHAARPPAGLCFLVDRNQTVALPAGGTTTVLVGSEKGIDVRLAFDVVAAARTNTCDVALIFSQDQDLSEVADEVRAISVEQNGGL